jgi:Domain of unknown function (DUF4412)
MKRVALLLGLVVASTAGAQSFEGTVTYQSGKNNETWQYSAKGGKIRIDVNDPHSPGGAMIWDSDTHTTMMVMPAQKMYMTMNWDKAMAAVPDTGRGKVTKVGSEVVAGIPCDDYQGTDSHGVKQGTYCIAHGMGNFIWFGGNNPMMKRMEARISGLSDATAGGGFPLKAVDASGETRMLAVKVEKKSLDASLFAPPAGYTQMQMPAGMQVPQH